MKKLILLCCLALVVLTGSVDAAKRYPSEAQSNFFWGLYGGYNSNNQLVERSSTGALNFNGNGNYYVALEANFVNSGTDYVLGIGYTGSRAVSSVSGLLSQTLTGVTWASMPVYFLTRYKLGDALYVTTGISYSMVTLQGNQINTIHGSTSFTTAGSLGYSLGLGLNLNRSMMLDLKYLVDRASITIVGGSNNGNTYPLEASGFILSLGFKI